MGMYVNDARNERTEHEGGATKGKQGGHGTGKVKCSAEGGKSGSPSFKTAGEMIGAPVTGELDVPGVSIVKGASAPGYEGPKRGSDSVKSVSGKVKKPKAAEESGY